VLHSPIETTERLNFLYACSVSNRPQWCGHHRSAVDGETGQGRREERPLGRARSDRRRRGSRRSVCL